LINLRSRIALRRSPNLKKKAGLNKGAYLCLSSPKGKKKSF
jgi:hypothetical protein